MGAFVSFDNGSDGLIKVKKALNDILNDIFLSKDVLPISLVGANQYNPLNHSVMTRVGDVKKLGSINLTDNSYWKPNNSFSNNNELIWGVPPNVLPIMIVLGRKINNTAFKVHATMIIDESIEDKENAYWLDWLEIWVRG